MHVRTYDDLKALAKELGRPMPSMYVQAGQNDPFMMTPARRRQGERFAVNVWHRFGLSHGVHLRRIHYLLVSQPEPVIGFDSRPYENTEKCFTQLCWAARDARYLRIVPPEAFVDRRTDEAAIFLQQGRHATAGITGGDMGDITLTAAESADELADLQAEYDGLRQQFNERFRGIRERVSSLYQAIENRLVVSPEWEWPEPDEGNEAMNPLYSSRRDYVDQVDRFKAHQGKPIKEAA
jgi:hypothetical protein